MAKQSKPTKAPEAKPAPIDWPEVIMLCNAVSVLAQHPACAELRAQALAKLTAINQAAIERGI